MSNNTEQTNSKKLRKLFLATAASIGIMSSGVGFVQAAENNVHPLWSELDPVTQTEQLADAKGDDALVSDNISVSQFHALEAAYTDDRITVEILTQMGLKTSIQTKNTSKLLNDNVDYVVEARKKLENNPLVRSPLHLRQMVRDGAVSLVQMHLKIPEKMATGELNAIDHDDILKKRYKRDDNFSSSNMVTYALGYKAMIDQSVTLSDLIAAGMTEYDNDSRRFNFNAGFIIEARDKSFADKPDLSALARTNDVVAIVQYEVIRHDEIDLNSFKDVVLSLKPEYRQKYEDLAYARKNAEDNIYYGELCYNEFFALDRLLYDADIDAQTVAQSCDKMQYMNLETAEVKGQARYIDDALGIVAEARDVLIQQKGAPNQEDEKAIRNFQKQTISLARELIVKYYNGRLEDFTDTATQDINDFKKYEYLLKNRIAADEYVYDASPEQYVWLQRALTDPKISKQTLLEAGLSEDNSGTGDLAKNVDVVIDMREKVLSQKENLGLKGEALRDIVREKAYAFTKARAVKYSAELKQSLKTVFAPIAGGVLGLFGLGFGAVRYRNYRRRQPQVKNN